jgi:hypothetical protein
MVKATFMAATMAAALLWMSETLAGPVAPIAMVTEIQGEGVIDAKNSRLKKLDVLSTPGTITMDAAAKVVVFYLDGAKEYTLNGPGTFEFSVIGLTRSSASGTMLIKRQNPAYSKENLLFKVQTTEAGVVLRDSTLSAEPDTPANDDTVPSLNLTFSWKIRPHQGTWQFRIIDTTGKVLYETEPLHNQAPLPETTRLPPDSSLLWEVRWIDRNGDQQLQSHRFRTLNADNETLAAQLKPGEGAADAPRTLYGLWLIAAGAQRLGQKYLSNTFNQNAMP